MIHKHTEQPIQNQIFYTEEHQAAEHKYRICTKYAVYFYVVYLFSDAATYAQQTITNCKNKYTKNMLVE